jgi:hypothetical protein
MSRKTRIRTTSIFFIWILVCAVFVGVAEGQAVRESLNVAVGENETEIIGSTLTDRYRNRRFRIENGETEIIATVWGSNDDQTWEYWDSITIGPGKTGSMVMGTNHFWYIKLTGKTISPQTSMVDAYLYYHNP